MKRELEHFSIGASYGGNQDWFPTFMMRVGGCGAETACDSSVYFALHRGLSKIAPANCALKPDTKSFLLSLSKTGEKQGCRWSRFPVTRRLKQPNRR